MKAGPRVLIVANHTSLLDALVFAAFLPERVSFVVNTMVMRRWWLKPLLRLVDTFAIDPNNPMSAKALIGSIKQDRKVLIFPEGRLTTTGALMKIYNGPAMIADKSDATILPIRIDGAQYSPTSRLRGKMKIRLFPKITLTFMSPQKLKLSESIQGRQRRQLGGMQLYDIMSQMIFESSNVNDTLISSLCSARRLHGGGHIIAEDHRREPMSYSSFIAMSFVIGRQISGLIKKEEQRIGLMLPNTVATAALFFAVQAIGRVAALLNFTAGIAQVISACKTAELKTIVTSHEFINAAKLTGVVDELVGRGISILYLEDIRSSIGVVGRIYGLFAQLAPEFLLPNKVKPDDAAVVLFTSGSEGMPKGVVLSHKNLLSNRFQLASRIDFGPRDVLFNCLPMFHAFGLTGATLLPLLSGVKVFFYPSPLHYRIIPELVYDCNATILFGTDTFLSGYARFANPYDFYTLRYVFAGAEKLREATRRTWMDKYGIRIFEGYGATETAPVISANTPMYCCAGTVGRVVPGIEVKLQSVPGINNGCKLSVRGPNIMLGYMRESNPGVIEQLNDGWYDTGDIVTVDDSGFITVQGRMKRFAKIAGG